jgi:argininosuccinate lyase
MPAFTGMIATLTFHTERMAELAPQGYSLATDVAEWLVKRHVTFRDAHEITGSLVKYAEERGLELHEVDNDALRGISEHLTSPPTCATCSASADRWRAATATAAPPPCASPNSERPSWPACAPWPRRCSNEATEVRLPR